MNTQKNYQTILRNKVLAKMGSVCARCGFSDRRALQLDHIFGGGTQIRKIRRNWHAFYRDILNDIDIDQYQLLCANCNWIKKSENREYGHKYQTK